MGNAGERQADLQDWDLGVSAGPSDAIFGMKPLCQGALDNATVSPSPDVLLYTLGIRQELHGFEPFLMFPFNLWLEGKFQEGEGWILREWSDGVTLCAIADAWFYVITLEFKMSSE